MKRVIVYLLCLVTLCALTGCALREGAAGRGGSPSASVSDVLNAGMAEADNGEQPEAIPSGNGGGAAITAPAAAKGEVDVDLTKMSATMVYSEVYNMMALPDDYLGKTVRMSGQFQVYEGEDRNYYAVIIADATACCQQGMEFVLAEDYVYPDDYPVAGTEVTVTGVFDTYYEGEYMRFCQLIDAKMTY